MARKVSERKTESVTAETILFSYELKNEKGIGPMGNIGAVYMVTANTGLLSFSFCRLKIMLVTQNNRNVLSKLSFYDLVWQQKRRER